MWLALKSLTRVVRVCTSCPGTYLVPGSHVDEHGNNRVTPDGGFEGLVPGNLVALTCPAGTCVITDGRILHSGECSPQLS